MKTVLVLMVATLGFIASVAWADEHAAPAAPVARTPTVRISADGTGPGRTVRAQPRQTPRALAVPDFETGAKSAPSVLCACVRDRHSA